MKPYYIINDSIWPVLKGPDFECGVGDRDDLRYSSIPKMMSRLNSQHEDIETLSRTISSLKAIVEHQREHIRLLKEQSKEYGKNANDQFYKLRYQKNGWPFSAYDLSKRPCSLTGMRNKNGDKLF